jgi:hypothetical protein
MVAAGLLWAAPGRAGTFYRLDFEGARLTPDSIGDNGKRFTLRRQGGGRVARIVKDGNKGSQVLLLSTAPTPAGADRDRSELQIHSGITWNRDWFVGLDVMIPPGTVHADTWHLLLQCPQAGTAHSPPISLNLGADGSLVLVARDDGDAYEPLWTGPLAQGRWVRLVLGFRMGENGRAQLWVGGRRVADIRRSLGWADGERRCVLKTGIYRGPAATAFALRLDNVSLGTGYADVARH